MEWTAVDGWRDAAAATHVMGRKRTSGGGRASFLRRQAGRQASKSAMLTGYQPRTEQLRRRPAGAALVFSEVTER